MFTAHSKQPNIVVIIADDLGWNDVSFHGSNEFMTPNIDAMGYHGIILNRHYVMPTCTPSRSAFLTGRYPIRNGMQGSPIGAGQIRGIPLSEKLLPQYLKDLGYNTHLVGKWHVGCYKEALYPTNRGFDTFFGYTYGNLGYFDGVHATSYLGAGMDAWRNTSKAWQEFVGHYLTDLLTNEAISIIKKHDIKKPLYLQIAHAAPHAGNKGTKMEVRDITANEKMFPHIADTERRLYAGMVKAVDDSVGNIVKTLSDTGLLENTVLVFISDNGAPTYERKWDTENHGSNWPLRGEKCSTHDGGVRVAAVAWSPLFPKAVVSSNLMHITDWLPTFYEAAGGNASLLTHLDGVSQFSALKTQAESPRKDLLIEINQNINSYAMISEEWKITMYNMSDIFGFSNYYYGSSGREHSNPLYNTTEVHRSAVGLALTKYGNISEGQYVQLRKQANIESLCSTASLNQSQMCDNRFCLFNIFDDPCETTDLSRIHPSILQKILQKVKWFNTTVVPITNEMYRSDPRAHPQYWNNYWIPWLDMIPESHLSSGSLNFMTINICLLFIVIIIHLLLIII